MTRLLERRAAGGMLTLRGAGVSFEAADVGPVTQLLIYPGAGARVSDALREAHGLTFPAAGRVETAGQVRLVWAGQDEALALGAELAADGAAAVDQSDGWAALALRGPGTGEVLARLCPVDLRPRVFRPGMVVRSLLGHVHALYLAEPDGVLILVPRSVAEHVVEEVAGVLAALEARPPSGSGGTRRSD